LQDYLPSREQFTQHNLNTSLEMSLAQPRLEPLTMASRNLPEMQTPQKPLQTLKAPQFQALRDQPAPAFPRRA